MAASYKGIVRYLVSRKLEDIVEKQSGYSCFIDSDSVKLDRATKDFDNISFTCTFRFSGSCLIEREYTAFGYVTEYGHVYLTSIAYSRVICKRLEDGSFSDGETKHYFVFDDDLKKFRFDD